MQFKDSVDEIIARFFDLTRCRTRHTLILPWNGHRPCPPGCGLQLCRCRHCFYRESVR
jgi:hypothetical protein